MALNRPGRMGRRTSIHLLNSTDYVVLKPMSICTGVMITGICDGGRAAGNLPGFEGVASLANKPFDGQPVLPSGLILNTRMGINTGGTNRADRVGNVVRGKPPGKDNRPRGVLYQTPANRPVVGSAGRARPARSGIVRIRQKSVDKGTRRFHIRDEPGEIVPPDDERLYYNCSLGSYCRLPDL